MNIPIQLPVLSWWQVAGWLLGAVACIFVGKFLNKWLGKYYREKDQADLEKEKKRAEEEYARLEAERKRMQDKENEFIDKPL